MPMPHARGLDSARFPTSGEIPTTGTATLRQQSPMGNRQHSHCQYSQICHTTTGGTMNLIIWLVVGGLIGWVASLIMKTDAQQGLLLNVIVGIVGALLGGWLLSPLVGAGTVNQGDFSLMGLLVSLGGAILLLFVVNLIRRGTAPKV
jgi:uncharacterized membrane protein YeaQ/YmgE (transglycosylase-associated protein family)